MQPATVNTKGKSHVFSYILGILGIILSTYLALLKVVELPCTSGDTCHRILHSKHSELFGIPVSIFSIFIWSAYLSLSGRIRIVSSLLLSIGAIYFTLLQTFWLEGFCIFCLAHSIVSLLTILTIRNKQSQSLTHASLLIFSLSNSFLISFLIIKAQSRYIEGIVTKQLADFDANSSPQSNETSDQNDLPLRLYSSRSSNANILVISPNCPACIERLKSFEKYLVLNPEASVPQIIWDSHGNESLVNLVISYQKNQSILTPILNWLESIQNQDLKPQEIIKSFKIQFPEVELGDNSSVMNYYDSWLHENPIAAVPALITPSGLVTTTFSSSDLSNQDLILPKVEPIDSSIDLGARLPGEQIEFTFTVKNNGNDVAYLQNIQINSLPNGEIKWSNDELKPNDTSTASVKWKIPNDYYGEAFARVAYHTNSTSFDLPIHVLVPYNGWVWPTIETDIEHLHETSFEIRNVENTTLYIETVSTKMPGVRVTIEENRQITFKVTGDLHQSEPVKNYELEVIASDGFKFVVPVRVHQ